MEINKNTIDTIRAELDSALATFIKKTGIKTEVGTITYTPNSISCRVTGVRAELTEEDLYNIDAKKMAKRGTGRLVLPYGTTFRADNTEYRIVALNPKSQKYFYIIRDTKTSKEFKASPSFVKLCLQKTAALAGELN